VNSEAPLVSASISVSVILPIYNAAEGLDDCLDALLSQAELCLQIVAVDDGSTDASGHILDAYAARHPNLTVIHTENQGAGRARLAGLAQAQGSYVGFCDSGDRPIPDMYATMLKRAVETSAGMVVCGFKRVDAESGRLISDEMLGFEQSVYSVSEDPGILLSLNTALWNKLYRADLIKDLARVSALPRVAEDMILQLLVYPHVRRIAFVEKPLYNYCVKPNSLMSRVTIEDFELLRMSLLDARRQLTDGGGDAQGSGDMPALYDLVAFTHLGLSLPLRLATTESLSLGQAIRRVRRALKQDFPLYSHSRFCSLDYVLRHKGRNLKLFVARLCHRFHLTTPLIGLLRFGIAHRWNIRYW
jgi:glycosyltransferase involved in cell wall biosynthesis